MASRPRARDEAVREVGVDGERLADTELFHHHETQAVGEAVGLIIVAFEVLEGLPPLIRRRPVDAGELFGVEPVRDVPRTRGRARRTLKKPKLGLDRVRWQEARPMRSWILISEGAR